jgi:nicotinate-nucleotide pyrophosphorylase (carboxylating)
LENWWKQVETVIEHALAEDLSWGDVTTEALIPPNLQGRASIVVKASGVLAGVEIAEMVFHKVDPSLQFKVLVSDGSKVQKGDIVARVEGRLASILKAERTALNFLQQLSGIASETANYVEATKGSPAQIMDTRKTTPGLRLLEKYAVRMGGGQNHRLHLGDAILVKDNHLAALRSQGVSLKEIIAQAKQKAASSLKVEVEVRTVEEALEASDAGADIIMLDNIRPEEIRRVVKLTGGKVLLEASGGVTLDNIQAIAETGVDFISVGALTHSAKALDIGLDLET